MFGVSAVSFRTGDFRFESFLILGNFSIDELSQRQLTWTERLLSSSLGSWSRSWLRSRWGSRPAATQPRRMTASRRSVASEQTASSSSSSMSTSTVTLDRRHPSCRSTNCRDVWKNAAVDDAVAAVVAVVVVAVVVDASGAGVWTGDGFWRVTRVVRGCCSPATPASRSQRWKSVTSFKGAIYFLAFLQHFSKQLVLTHIMLPSMHLTSINRPWRYGVVALVLVYFCQTPSAYFL